MKDNLPLIINAKRTPIGSFLGELSNISATDLGAITIRSLISECNVTLKQIDSVIMGCVLSAGLGQAPARQAMIKAQIPVSASALTINKMCGSGLCALMLAANEVQLGLSNYVIAGGMENMSQAPYLLKKARSGYRLGHDKLFDHMMLDGLEDAYLAGKPMGYFAEVAAKKFAISRQDQDQYAAESMTRAINAQQNKYFDQEIVKINDFKVNVGQDQSPCEKKLKKLSYLKPVFVEDGTVTAGNSSSIADGSSAIIICSAETAKKDNLKPLAKICGHAVFSDLPELFTSAPVGAIKKLIKKLGWAINEVDLFEINEAFAVVPIIAMNELDIDRNKINIHGGACALGHPIGASGARIMTTLIYSLKLNKKRRGIATLCIGGGEAVAMAIEIIN